MKIFVLVALAMLASIPTLAQNQASCKAFFQVLRADAGTPGLHAGLDPRQKRWWAGGFGQPGPSGHPRPLVQPLGVA